MRFDCFGGRCGVWGGDEAAARRQLEAWHRRFSRFRPDSELSRLNRDPREVVPVSVEMARLLIAIRDAAAATGGLVDATLLGEIEAAGYATDLGAPVPLDVALALAPPRAPARPRAERPHFALLRGVDSWFVRRPPGLMFDSGGLAKGLFADLLAERTEEPFAIDCGGDLRFGGRRRTLEVADPFGGPGLHVFEIFEGAAATSGIGRRSWLDARGRPAHHLLDPSTGAPAFTGVVQTTAFAPTAVEAEWRAKAALLTADPSWLARFGGLIVFDDSRHELVQVQESALDESKVHVALSTLMPQRDRPDTGLAAPPASF